LGLSLLVMALEMLKYVNQRGMPYLMKRSVAQLRSGIIRPRLTKLIQPTQKTRAGN